MDTAAYRFGAFDLMVGSAALIVILAVAGLLQHAGVAQPYAMAAGMLAGLLALYPAMRRWSRSDMPLHKWAVVVAAIVLVSLALHLLLLRI